MMVAAGHPDRACEPFLKLSVAFVHAPHPHHFGYRFPEPVLVLYISIHSSSLKLQTYWRRYSFLLSIFTYFFSHYFDVTLKSGARFVAYVWFFCSRIIRSRIVWNTKTYFNNSYNFLYLHRYAVKCWINNFNESWELFIFLRRPFLFKSVMLYGTNVVFRTNLYLYLLKIC